MKKIAGLYLMLPLLLLYISGCVPLIIGGAVGAVGGYAISKDTIQGDTDKPYDSLWNSALIVCKNRGIVREEDSLRGYIQADIENSRVVIRLIRLTQESNRIKIQARNKYRFPNLNLAQDLFVKIIEQAR
jgi:hypothetical protein